VFAKADMLSRPKHPPLQHHASERKPVMLLECLACAGMYSDVMDYASAHREKVIGLWRSPGKAHALALPLVETLGQLSFLRCSHSSTRGKDRNRHFVHLTFQGQFVARYFVHHWSSRDATCALELGTEQREA
jgi:hypothetical protein